MGLYKNTNGVLSPIAGRGNIDGVYRANGILGAKNLLKVPYHHNTGVEFPVGGNVTNAGITYTHNADHSIKANGTATGGSYCIFNRKQDWSEFDLYGKEVTLSVSPVSNSVFLQLYDTDNSRTVCRTDSSTGEVTFTFPTELKNNTSWNISINFPTGAEPNNTTYYSMLRLASDTDSTYQPYAMTNKELTDTSLFKYKTVATSTYTSNKTVGQYLTDLITPYASMTEEEKKNARIIFNGALFLQNSKPLPHGYQNGVFVSTTTSSSELRTTVFEINPSLASIKAYRFSMSTSGVTADDISSEMVWSSEDSIEMVLETTRA